MSSKFIRCLLSLLLFNYVVGHIIEDRNNEEYDDGEKLSVDDKFENLEANIIQKLESLGRLEDLISKGNKQLAGSKTDLDAIEKKLPELEDKIKRTLDIIEKIPESLEKINQRLDALENAPKLEEQVKSLKDISEILPLSVQTLNPKLEELVTRTMELRSVTDQTLKAIQDIPESFDRVNSRLNILEKSSGPDTLSTPANRSTSPTSDQDVNDLENLVTKLEKDFIASNKLYNENLFKNETHELDDLDNLSINPSGCKYQPLNYQDLSIFRMDNKITSLINVAYQQLLTYRYIPRADFETHMSIRSTGDVYILLWEVAMPDITDYPNRLRPTYEIGLGVKDRFNNMISTFKTQKGFWKESTPHTMAANQYNKFYIKAYNGTLEFGSRCDEAPIHVHKVKRSGRIVAMGLLSTAVDGAKILLDCPASTCADSM